MTPDMERLCNRLMVAMKLTPEKVQEWLGEEGPHSPPKRR